MLHIPRLVIVAGTGRKVGKTMMACRIIENFAGSNITAVKISSHFHEPQAHLRLIFRSPDYTIWEELSSNEDKDSSRLLAAGATRSFYIQAEKGSSVDAFIKLLDLLPYSGPVVCESPSLAGGVIPGTLIIVSGDQSGGSSETFSGKSKELSFTEIRNILRIRTSEIKKGLSIPLNLSDSGFTLKDIGGDE